MTWTVSLCPMVTPIDFSRTSCRAMEEMITVMASGGTDGSMPRNWKCRVMASA